MPSHETNCSMRAVIRLMAYIDLVHAILVLHVSLRPNSSGTVVNAYGDGAMVAAE